MKRTIGIVECNYSSIEREPLTAVRPVASLPFHGRYRLIDFVLSNMVNAGVGTIGLMMPTNCRSILDHVGSGKEWGLARKRGGLFPAPGSPFGTTRQGGRFLLKDLLNNRAIFTRNNYDYVLFSTANFVMNIDFNTLLAEHQATGADITMLVQAVPEGKNDVNVVRVLQEDGQVTGTELGVSGGDTAFLDAFIIDRDTLAKIMKRYAEYAYMDLFEALAIDRFGAANVQTFEYEGYAAPVFNMATYYRVSRDLLDPELAEKLFLTDRTIKTKSHDTTPAKYETGCKVSSSLISSSCRIRGEVSGSVLGRHVIVEPGAKVVDSILMQGTRVKAGATIENCIIDRNNTIEENSILSGSKEHILYCPKSDDYLAGTDN